LAPQPGSLAGILARPKNASASQKSRYQKASQLKYYTPPTTSDPWGNFLRSHASSDFDVPTDGLAAVPLHQIGDAALITAVLNLRGVMGRIKRYLDDVRDSKGVMPFSADYVRNQRTSAFNAVASVLRIVKGPAAEEKISRLA
jgi:hypothetical protein